METNLLIRFALFCDDDHRVADDLVTDLVALLENLRDAAALLALGGGGLRNGVHEVGVKRLIQSAVTAATAQHSTWVVKLITPTPSAGASAMAK